jgi:prepilin-type N-terminal cleavage/methylation domain-containing protein
MKKKKGFTIVETLVVLALMGIIAALSIGYSLRSKERWTLRGISREVTSSYYEMRARASRENSPCKIEFDANSFTTFFHDGLAWIRLNRYDIGEKVTISKVPNFKPGFAVNSSGFIIDPDTRMIVGAQVITLSLRRGAGIDRVIISIYPYGGLRVENKFI